jgi:hypothetical protein
MHLLKSTRPRPGWKRLAPALGLLLFFVCSASSALAQDEPQTNAANQEFTVTELLNLPGRVLIAGGNRKAAGRYKVASYRVEVVNLPHATEVEIRGEKVQATKAFRVTVTGGPFPVRAAPPIIWVDDVAVGFGVENEDLTEITVITYDLSLLREAATLYLSYGDKKNRAGRDAVPERLKLIVGKGGEQ